MAYTEQRLTSFRQWSEKTFSFTTTRPTDFRFENGEFVTIGLRVEGKLIARAYSIVSTNDDDYLEFLSIHVPGGPLTSRLVHLRQGESVWINSRPTGSLTLRSVRPGRNLYMLATGTGLAPFMSLIRDPELYRRYARVILAHSVRTAGELAYQEEIRALCGTQLLYVPTVTRGPYVNTQRVTQLFRSGELATMLGVEPIDPARDCAMLCGNPQMLREMSEYLESQGWTGTNHKGIGNFTVEKAFVVRDTP